MKINKNIFICAILVAMMLVCVSAVSAEDTLDADLGAVASDDAVELSIDDAKESETLETGSSSGEILAAGDTVVTNATFFDYFDENGVINKSISTNELVFDGGFSDLGIDTITVDTPITLSAKNDTMFKDIGFKVISDNVKLTGFEIKKTTDGIAIDIQGTNVTVDDVGIDIHNAGQADTFAIRAIESDNLKLLNNVIIYIASFDANNTNVYNQVIQVRDSNNVRIKKNIVAAALPSLDVDYSKSGIDTDYPLVIGVQNAENVTIEENDISSDVLFAAGSYPTLNTVMVETVKNLQITNNDIRSTDMNGDNKSGYLYVLDLYRLTDSEISDNNITAVIPGGAPAKGSAYGMQLNGLTTNMGIYRNNFTSEGNGYAYGIYTSDYYGAVEAEIINNNFDITGYAGTKKSNLVTAMELSITKAVIEGNYITTKMLNNYSDDLRVFGICYSSSNKRNHTYTISDNNVETEGKYAVYLMNVVDANVTDNALFAHELYGDDAVYIDSGSNIVKDNIPPYTVTNDTFFYFFDENGVIADDWRELVFEGNFSDLGIDAITIDVPVNIVGASNDTVLWNIGLKILSDDVNVVNMGIYKENGTAIDIKGSDVALDDVTMRVVDYGLVDGYAIRASESDNLNIVDSIIYYLGAFDANHTKTYQHVIDIRDSNNVNVESNEIMAMLPPMTPEWYGVGIDQDFPLVIGIQNCENFTLAENNINAYAYPAYPYTTLDVVMVNNATNLAIIYNNITEIGSGNDVVLYLYAVDLYNSNGILVSGNDIVVNTTTGIDGSGAAYPIQMTGPLTDIVIDDNNLVSISKGPSYGIYASNWGGSASPVEVVISDNIIDVIGNASNSQYSLIAGMVLDADEASVLGNVITVKNLNAYNETNKAYGISNSQGGNHTFNIMDNLINVDGKYAVYITNSLNSSVTDNTLFAHELIGDDSVFVASGSAVVENNTPPFEPTIAIDSPAVWFGNDGNITVFVQGATGNVTIKVGNKTYDVLTLVNCTATLIVDAADLVDGINDVVVTYSGDKYLKPGNETAILRVLNGVVTNETFFLYFNEDDGNYLYDDIPEGTTLDFQGLFLSDNYTVYIDKPVNVISSTGDAVFDSNTTNKQWVKFNIVEGADGTNISDIIIINGDLFIIGASNVTVDGIYMKANMTGVGSGTGFIAIHTGAYYTTVKNSYFENGGTGSSILVLGKGGKYATFDNNIFNVTGSSGNIVSSNIFVGAGENPECANYTNNIIFNAMPEAGTMYGMTVCGANNIIENNTIHNFKGSGIVNQWGATSTKNVYRNNTITGGAGLTAGTYSIIEGNYLEGTLTIAEGCNATGNTAKTASISGKDTIVDNNNFTSTVTIAAAAKNTTFTNNYLKDALTVSSNDNIITDNQISTEKAYAVDLKSTSGNTVKYNELSSADKMGDEAVSFVEGKNNTVEHNGMNAIIEIEVADAWTGYNNTINVTVVNATGTVTIKVNGKEFEPILLKDGKATLVVPAADIEVGLNDIIVDYSGDENISAESKAASFYGMDNVVFTEIFFNYFDEDGFLKDDVPYTDLVFKGAFAKSSTVKYIVIDRPLNITGDGATLSQMAIIVASDNVMINNLKFTATVNNAAGSEFDLTGGALISVAGSKNVILENLDINYRVTAGDHDAIAINVIESDYVIVYNNTIVFASTITNDYYSANAINLDNVTYALVLNNTVSTTLPGLLAENYDGDYFMMGLNTVNPVRVRNVTNLTFAFNSIDSKLNSVGKTTPTIQCLYVVGTNNATFAYNKFNLVDTKSAKDAVIYLYAFNFGYCKNIEVLENDFYLSTNGGKDSAGSAYALQGVESEISIIGNSITTSSNGPNLGVYVASMMGGSSETLITDNVINVTGYATSSSSWALVSGIEITNGNAYIYDNSIVVNNKAGYVEKAPVHGVSYAQYMYGDRSLDVHDNYMDVQGTYAVSVLDGTDANVTYNILYSSKYHGDRAVYAVDGIVENNTPLNAYLFVDFDDITVGEDAVFNITFDANDTGDVSLIINGKLYEVNATNGTAQIIVSGLDAGEYTVAAYLTESGPYGADEFDDVLTVARYETSILIDVADVKSGENAKVTFDLGKATGKVIAIIDGVEKELKINYRGQATTTINAISAGNHSIVAIYNGDDNYAAAYNATAFAVEKRETPISLNITAARVGEESTFTVELDEMASGLVLITVDEDIYAISLNMDNSINITFLDAGIYNVTAVYLGDDYFEANATEIIPLEIKDKEIANIDVQIPDDIKVGDTIVINVTADTDAELLFTINGVIQEIENGTVTYTVDAADKYDVMVQADETAEYQAFTEIATFEVYKTNATIEIKLPENITVSQDMEIGVETNSDGKVVVLIDGVEYEVADGKVTIFNLAGDHDIVAYVNETDAYTGAMAFETYIVDKKDSSIEIVGNDAYVGELVTFNITGSEGATGYVLVCVDNEDFYAVEFMHNNTATLEIVFDDAGNHTVYAFYEGNIEFNPATSEDITIVVTEKESVETNITLPSDVKAGETTRVTVSIPGATGNVSVFVDSVEAIIPLDENGTATYDIPVAEAGDHSVIVLYPGDETHDAAVASATFTVTKEASEANITTPADFKIGEPANVTVSIPGATGDVSVFVDGIETIAPLDEKGTATVTIDEVTPGEHSIVVLYPGDDIHAPVVENATFYAEIFASEFRNLTVEGEGLVSGCLVIMDTPIANATIIYKINGTQADTTTDKDGMFYFNATFPATVEITYAGTDAILPVDTTITLKDIAPVRAATAIKSEQYTTYAIDVYAGEKGGYFKVQLVDENGNALANKSVKIGFNGVVYDKVTDSNGWAQLQINLAKEGEYTFAIAFLGDKDYNASFVVQKIVVNKKKTSISASAKSFKASAKTKSYTVTLKTDKGSSIDGKVYLNKGKKLTMTINGKTYTAKTNSKGQATFKLSITKKGKFSSTVKFEGDNTYAASSKSVKITIN